MKHALRIVLLVGLACLAGCAELWTPDEPEKRSSYRQDNMEGYHPAFWDGGPVK